MNLGRQLVSTHVLQIALNYEKSNGNIIVRKPINFSAIVLSEIWTQGSLTPIEDPNTTRMGQVRQIHGSIGYFIRLGHQRT